MSRIQLILLLGFILTACVHNNRGQSAGASKMGQKQDMQVMMMSPEMHEGMAAMHQEVAQCLKSGKAKQDCMEIMRSHHQKMCEDMGKENCMMMGKMMMNQNADVDHEIHHQ
ncbi:MAG: hypothetical protein ACOH5I_12795 [Oligoflexus sp.]